MTYRMTSIVALLVVAVPTSAEDRISYDKEVRPIFRKHCLTCHNAERARGELDLSTYSAMVAGSASGKPAVPGEPEQSLIYTSAAHLEDPKMPPNKPRIPQRELDTIRKWIESGMAEKPGDQGPVAGPEGHPIADGGFAPPIPLSRPTAITALAVSPTEHLIAVPGRNQVVLLDGKSGQPAGALPFPEGEVHSLKFSRDGQLLLVGGGVGGASGVVVGFDVPTGKRAFAVGEELDAVLAADVTADRSRVVLGGPGRTVKVFSALTGEAEHTFRKPTDWVTAVAFSPDGLLVAAGDRFGGLFVWEVLSGKEFHVLRGHTKAIAGIAWRADSNTLTSISEDGTGRVWNMHTGEETAHWDAHPGGGTTIDLHPSGRIATGGRDKRVKVWDEAGKPVADLGPASDIVTRVAMTADGNAVVAGDWSGAVRVWPVDGGESVHLSLPLEPIADAVAVSLPAPQMRPLAVNVAVPSPAKSTPDPRTEAIVRELSAARQALDEANRAIAEAERALKELTKDTHGQQAGR